LPEFGYPNDTSTFAPVPARGINKKPSIMKKVFAIFAIAAVMVACNNSSDKKTETTDSAAINNMVDSANQKMDNMVDSATNKMNNMVDSAKDKMNDIIDSTKPKM
jgi:ABC-type uncharacterized transport system auxiliary subunit